MSDKDARNHQEQVEDVCEVGEELEVLKAQPDQSFDQEKEEQAQVDVPCVSHAKKEL